ncbi:hypothetical protein CDO22_08425 [Sinorhizobium meliloti]|uniref:hypothetical protein n=1 Tax=Rhizobium meliloti TaxID=382 RepID=UPI000B4A3AB6|nr:hypothetical protein [Sinorhizobium meliloti]ASQ10186.1 hypothetical protein CDO22_08425 [Sinorhizobium meliloti]MQU82944.1 hypothetical protein [Sinorhizobium meliloti]
MTIAIAELIERLQDATGPNYALEIDIFKFLHPEYAEYVQGRGGLIHPCDGEDVRVQSNVRAPNYTASLDAAMALAVKLLDDGFVDIEVAYRSNSGRTIARSEICSPRFDARATSATPAIALCLAALRAYSEVSGA